MNNIENYKKRFFTLVESEMGNVKPLLSEQMELNSKENILKFQTWVKQHYPSFDLGKTGENKDGIDGNKGGRTSVAWSKFSKEYLDSQKYEDNSMAKSGKQFVDAGKETTSRMLDSGDFDYNYIENRISDSDAAKLLNDILDKEDSNFLYNLPEAVIEAIFLRVKNGGCGFFYDFFMKIEHSNMFEDYITFNTETKLFDVNWTNVKKYFETKLPMDINKTYHKESIASILGYLSQNCKSIKKPI